MTEHEKTLAHQQERDRMFYRERAVDHALILMKQNEDSQSVAELVGNADVIYNFIKGTPNE